MQKLNFLIAFFVVFFFGCVVTETGADCSCQVTGSTSPAVPASEVMSVSPDLVSDAGIEDLVDTEMSVGSDGDVDSAAEVMVAIQ